MIKTNREKTTPKFFTIAGDVVQNENDDANLNHLISVVPLYHEFYLRWTTNGIVIGQDEREGRCGTLSRDARKHGHCYS